MCTTLKCKPGLLVRADRNQTTSELPAPSLFEALVLVRLKTRWLSYCGQIKTYHPNPLERPLDLPSSRFLESLLEPVTWWLSLGGQKPTAVLAADAGAEDITVSYQVFTLIISDLLRSMSGKPCAGQICISFWHLLALVWNTRHRATRTQAKHSIGVDKCLWPMGPYGLLDSCMQYVLPQPWQPWHCSFNM